MPVDKAKHVRATLSSLEKMSTTRDRENLARFGINATKAFGVSMANIQVAGETPRAQSRTRRRPLGHRLVRGAHAGLVRRRAGARHARADGPLVPRLRQLGHLRHRVLQAVRPHAARLGQGRAVERASARSSSSARPSRCSRASPGTTRPRRTRQFLGEPAARRARRDRRTELRQEGRELGAAPDRPAQRRAARESVALARRLAASPDAAARWVGKDALRDLTRPLVTRRFRPVAS